MPIRDMARKNGSLLIKYDLLLIKSILMLKLHLGNHCSNIVVTHPLQLLCN